ncbi:PA0069 family radical SAM protein [Dokdonella sp.]|uniref:PA0069 family radical SAM protein n=1 Tax=Dokdonella sp. TaxID=2291710 RepID=UPI003C4D4843
MARNDPDDLTRPTRIKGRGAGSNREGRFESLRKTVEDDGWYREEEGTSRPPTRVSIERARSIISRNESPDIPFNQSINPYRGCEHGCNYCYARPTHAYLNLSPGLDFETQLFAKTNAAERLRVELAKPGHVCEPITLGANTDAYQPIEREYRITREIIELLHSCRHPLTIITKNALVERDLDLLAPMARDNLVQVFVSIGILDNRLASTLEPRATAPHRRMQIVANLHEAGVPCGVLVAPIIPAVTDMHMEHVLEQAAELGANIAGYTVLRLPHELKGLFREWLDLHVPDRAEHVMSLIRQMRGGRENDARFASRMRGEGVYADLIRQRFALACRKYGLKRSRELSLDCSKFIAPRRDSAQGDLF